MQVTQRSYIMKSQTIATSRVQKRIWFAFATAALLAVSAFAVAPQPAQARVFISVNIAPPLLPIYEQPPLPGMGYIWAPGYWAYDYAYGYYWVPGTWIRAPYIGALWTPGYWGWGNSAYLFYPGYWGLSVGYYGGIDYGYGYNGDGYYGGYWNSGNFYYNSTVNNITNITNITNVYSKPVATTATVTRASFNGPGGVTRQATAAELAAAQQRHTGPVSAQLRQQALARQNPALRASRNHGTPPILATPRAGVFARTGAASAAAARSTRLGQPAAARASTRRSVNNIAPRQGTLRTARSTSLGERTSSARVRRESAVSRPSMQHRQPVIRADRSRSNNPPATRMRNSSRIERSAGPRAMPAMHSAGPRPNNPGMRNQEQRQAPAMRSQAPREAPAPRGERHPPSDKPKDHNRGG